MAGEKDLEVFEFFWETLANFAENGGVHFFNRRFAVYFDYFTETLVLPPKVNDPVIG